MRHNKPMKAAIPFHKRNSNTSAPPETLKGEEKIVELGGMFPTYAPGDGNEGRPSKNDGGDEPAPYQ